MLIRLDRLIRGDMWRPCGGDDPGSLVEQFRGSLCSVGALYLRKGDPRPVQRA